MKASKFLEKKVTIKELDKRFIDREEIKEVIEKYIIEKTKGIKFGRPINPMKLKKELGLE